MPIGHEEIVGIVIVASFAAGLNVYATVATLGLLGHTTYLQLPPTLHGLTEWWVIGIAAVLFAVEFVADKIPAFDMLWNAMHTFIRVPIAAFLSYRATAHLSPTAQMIATAAGGLIALASHSGKTAVRAAVTPSPEPFSNIALSAGEDAAAIGLTWFATKHPYVAVAIVVVALVIMVSFIRWLVRAMKRLFRGARQEAHALEAG